jgi:hypothetical protein
MPVNVDYSRIDGALALACEETPEDERSLTVFVHTKSPPDREQVEKLSSAGVNVPSGERKIFTATLSPAEVAVLSHEPWIRNLKLSQRLRMT